MIDKNKKGQDEFNNRIFGFVLVKSINSNYNADFTHQPRTLPDGTVYATDKVLKYSIRNYIRDNYPKEKVFNFKRLKDNGNPMSLEEAYNYVFEVQEKKTHGKETIAKNLLSCIDIRLFGATFAPKGSSNHDNFSLHGPVQITHGINIWKENDIYSEQIMSPFRNPNERAEDAEATTLGRQFKLKEGHYIHHFSVNPKNLKIAIDVLKSSNNGVRGIKISDVAILKDALRKGVTYYESSAKAGTDNEFLFWVQLKEGSKAVLANFVELVAVDKENSKLVVDLSRVSGMVNEVVNETESVEIYYLPQTTTVKNLNITNVAVKKFNLNTGDEISS